MLMKARERWHCTNTECGSPLRLRPDHAQKIRFAGLHLSGFSALRSAADPAARVAHPNHTRTLNMFADLLHLHSDARPAMALAVRGRAIRTFSLQALVLTLSMALLGIYSIVDGSRIRSRPSRQTCSQPRSSWLPR